MKVSLDSFGKAIVLLFGGLFHIVLPIIPNALVSTMMPNKTLHLVLIGLLGAGTFIFLFLREKRKMTIFVKIIGTILIIAFLFSAIEQFRASMTWWNGHYSINLALGFLDVTTTFLLTTWVIRSIAKVNLRWMENPLLIVSFRPPLVKRSAP